MSEDITLKMMFGLEEVDAIRDYCLEKNVSVYDLVRTAVLDKIAT